VTVDLDEHLAGIASGDAAAFGRWVAGAEPELRRGLRRFAVYVDVEAVLQEALLRVWQVAPRHSGDGRPNGLLRLAVRVARNLSLDELRRQRLGATVVEAVARAAESDGAPQPAAPDPFLRQAVAECRERLGGKPAAALSARLESGGVTSDRALADAAGMKPNTFLQNITRARRLLARCLRGKGIDLELELS